MRGSFTVLVVDDSPVARRLVERALPAGEYTLLAAETVKEALEIFEKHHPGLIITDWDMPDLSGIDLCKRIQALPEGDCTYIILLTGISDKAQVVKALEAGADDYLTKPFHAEELLARARVGRRTVELHREIEAKNRLLEQLALTDALTGLSNRRAIEEWALRQWSGATRHGFSLWAIMADLDNFKSVNDTHGHHAGDLVLKKFAEILNDNIRQCDMCARVGGEEFLAILTHVDQEGTLVFAERIREQFAAHAFEFDTGEAHVTSSFGVAGPPYGQSPDFHRLVARADAALYMAKRLGRNRVEIMGEDLRNGKKSPS
ncbi:MAG: diguanylate cyclase [Candidatus Acidiferrales bacterium]